MQPTQTSGGQKMDAPIVFSNNRPSPDESQVLAVPPPLDADALRISIISRLDQYLELHAAGANYSGSLDASNPTNHRAIQFRMVQSTLVRDIQELSHLTLELENRLLLRRPRVWLIHTSLAVVSHAFLVRLIPTLIMPLLRSWRFRQELGQRQPLGFGMLAMLLYPFQWSGYPIAIHNIVASEKRISDIASLREALSAIEMAVEKGAHVEDACCLSAESWKYIPWQSLRV